MQEKDSEKLLNKIWWQIYAGVYVLSLHKFGVYLALAVRRWLQARVELELFSVCFLVF